MHDPCDVAVVVNLHTWHDGFGQKRLSVVPLDEKELGRGMLNAHANTPFSWRVAH